MPQQHDNICDQANASLEHMDNELRFVQNELSAIRSSIGTFIESDILMAYDDVSNVKQVLSNAIDEHIVDATDETFYAYGEVDRAITQSLIDAYIACQSCGLQLPNISLENLEKMGYSISGFDAKKPKKKGKGIPIVQNTEPLPPISDPSTPPGGTGTEEWLTSAPANSNCVNNPYIDPMARLQPKTTNGQVNGITINTPSIVINTSSNVDCGDNNAESIYRNTGAMEAGNGWKIATGKREEKGEPSTSNTQNDGTLQKPIPYQTPQETITAFNAPKEEPAVIPFTGIAIADEKPAIAFPEAPPEVKLPGALDFDMRGVFKCHAADRLADIKEVAIKLGKLIINAEKDQPETTLSINLLQSLADKYWDKFKHLNTDYLEMSKQYLESKGMAWFCEQWYSGLGKALEGYADDVFYLSATRAFLQASAMSFLSLHYNGKAGAGMDQSNKEDTTRSLGLSLPFMPDTASIGTGSKTQITEQWHLGYEADKGFQTGITIPPFIAPLIGIIDSLIETSARANTLTSEQAVACYLRGGLSYACMEQIINLNGGDMTEYDHIILASSERLNTSEILACWRRKLITVETRDKLLRRIGWTSNQQVSLAAQLTEFIPGPSDLIRFMVRDVADTDVVKEFNLDAEFDTKWKGNLQKQGFSQGISDETAKDYWRSHWDLPGLHSVYDALHRFRDDGTFEGDKSLITTQKEVQRILAYNDMLPVWRERLVALSYSPLTRVDAQRMYMLGVIQEKRLYQSFRDIGYDDSNAKGLVAFTQQRRYTYLRSLKPSSYYRDGYISKDQFKSKLERYKVTDDEFNDLVSDMELQSKSSMAKSCIKALKERYFLGAFNDAQIRENIIERGYNPDHADRLISAWKCELTARGRELSASVLCKLATEGLISPTDYHVRLVRLGYTNADAKLISQLCYLEDERKKIKAKQKSNEQQLKEIEKAENEQRTREAKDKADDVKASKASERRAKTVARRKKQLRNAAEVLSGTLQIDLLTAVDTIDAWITKFEDYFDIDKDAAQEMVIAALKNYWPKDSGSLDDWMNNAIEAYSRMDDESNSGMSEQ